MGNGLGEFELCRVESIFGSSHVCENEKPIEYSNILRVGRIHTPLSNCVLYYDLKAIQGLAEMSLYY
jgi:hypothetical protein